MWIEKFMIPALLAMVTALSTYMVSLLKENRKINSANSKGMMLLLRRQLIHDHTRFCINHEPMTHFDFKDLTEIHGTYKDLGGNGLTDKMYEELRSIEIGDSK